MVGNIRVCRWFAAEVAERPKQRQTPRNIIAILVTQRSYIAEMVRVHVVEAVRFGAAIGANLFDAHTDHLPGNRIIGALNLGDFICRGRRGRQDIFSLQLILATFFI